jgi:hypothetical protein
MYLDVGGHHIQQLPILHYIGKVVFLKTFFKCGQTLQLYDNVNFAKENLLTGKYFAM